MLRGLAMSSQSLSQVIEAVDDIAKMLRAFVVCEMYGVIDRLANATGKEAVEEALYEALRAARAASGEGRNLCKKNDKEIKPHLPSDRSVSEVLRLLDEDLLKGLDVVKKIVLKALSVG